MPLLTPGVATTALYRGQEDNTAGETMGKTDMAPSCPQVPTVLGHRVPQEGQQE